MILMHICLFILIPTWIFWEDFSPPESVFCFSPVFTCRSLKKKNDHPAPIITPEINSLLINSLHLLITCSHLLNLRWSISSQSPLRTGFCHPELSYCWSCFCVSPFFFFFFAVGAIIVQNLCRFLTCGVVIMAPQLLLVLLLLLGDHDFPNLVFMSIRFQLVWLHPISYYYHQVTAWGARLSPQAATTVQYTVKAKLLWSFIHSGVLFFLNSQSDSVGHRSMQD